MALPDDSSFQWHTVHHRGFDTNFGQLISIWDRLFGTYESPEAFAKRFIRSREKQTLVM